MKKVEKTSKSKVIAIGILVITSLIVLNGNAMNSDITESENDRFNQWVTYFTNCEGYTVEYQNFDDYNIESDKIVLMQGSQMASDIRGVRDLTGVVTVYFDWENDIIFYGGSDTNSVSQKCYYIKF